MNDGNTRRHAGAIAAVIAVGVLLGGCGQIRDVMGRNKDAPDEFQVVARAPLALPPNYDLRPPEPGAQRPQELSPTDEAAARILGRRAASTAPATRGVQVGPTVQAAPRAPVTVQTGGAAVLRDQLRLDEAEAGIRRTVDQETANFVYEDEYPIDFLLFWRDKPEPGIVLDAQRESQRLRENAALGQPVDTGESPVIQRKRQGLFGRIF